jgi:hypothetical protein
MRKFALAVYFCTDKLNNPMGHSHDNHDHHGHMEAEQNEIGGPVTFALICFAIAIVIIYFWAQ